MGRQTRYILVPIGTLLAVVLLALLGNVCLIPLARAASRPQPTSRATTRPAPRVPENIPGEYFQFARIPAGTFMMGSPANESERFDNETQHKVTISRPFELQTTPVTQALWQAVMGSNPSHFKGPDLPVEMVSWNDAQTFIGKLNRKLGTKVYRLPTEAEWEYAARAGTTTPFWTGENLTTNQANYNPNYPFKEGGRGTTTPVKSFSPNTWGLYDMHGNVWQWVQDWEGDFTSGSVTDPTGPRKGLFRVNRGGAWNFNAGNCRSAFRHSSVPELLDFVVGFRLARSQ